MGWLVVEDLVMVLVLVLLPPLALGLLSAEGQSLILAGAILSVALNPLVFPQTGS